MANIIGIYHGDCADGTTAAAVLLTKFPSAEVFPLKHHYEETDIAPILEKIDKDTAVYTVDNAIGVERFLPLAKEVFTIDHHIGVNKEMEALAAAHENFTYVFDNNKSGASLTWSYFFPDKPMPEVVKYVEDVDIWNWRYGEESKYIDRVMIPLANQPEKVRALFARDIAEVLDEGKRITAFTDFIIKSYVERAEPVPLSIGGANVPAFNTGSLFVSEIGSLLSEKYGSAVALFGIKGDRVHVSFRSKDGQSPSALELAESLGGGGHTLAAAANVPLKEFCEMIVCATPIHE